MVKKIYTLGTRDSKLALIQAEMIRKALQLCHQRNVSKQIEFKIATFKTSGDLQTDHPLWQMSGDGFFTKELERALLDRQVDLVVHSYKDLGEKRPTGLVVAAVSKREMPHDVLLIRRSIVQTIQKAVATADSNTSIELIIGTSSPRRTYLVPNFLQKYWALPHLKINIITKPLRGNVITRMKKLVTSNKTTSDDEGKFEYDAITLALAGLDRLAREESIIPEVRKLFSNVDFLLLPLNECPPAAAQGALAIECREEEKLQNSYLFQLLTQINDSQTEEETACERSIFQKYGGGCHLAVGVYARKWEKYMLQISKGISDQRTISTSQLIPLHKTNKPHEPNKPYRPNKPKNLFFCGLPPQSKNSSTGKSLEGNGDFTILYDEMIKKVPINYQGHNHVQQFEIQPLGSEDSSSLINLLVTSKHCISTLLKRWPPGQGHMRIWAAGTKTMQELFTAGYWVSGAADFGGSEDIKNVYNSSSSIQLLCNGQLEPSSESTKNSWKILTNDSCNNLSENGSEERVACYHREICNPTSVFRELISQTTFFFWSSFFQFEKYQEFFPEIISSDRYHGVGIGKTWQQFKQHALINTPAFKIIPALGVEDFLNQISS